MLRREMFRATVGGLAGILLSPFKAFDKTGKVKISSTSTPLSFFRSYPEPRWDIIARKYQIADQIISQSNSNEIHPDLLNVYKNINNISNYSCNDDEPDLSSYIVTTSDV